MLPRQAGKSRYRDGSGSTCRWRGRAESVAGQQFGGQVGPEISSCTELSVAFALLVKSASGAHPHMSGSTAENCAALGMAPMGDTSRHARPLRNKNQPNVGAACE